MNLAWAGGFYSGEGSTIFQRDRRPRKTRKQLVRSLVSGVEITGRRSGGGRVIMSVKQVDRRALKTFMEVVRGGKIFGPYAIDLGRSQPISYWQSNTIDETLGIAKALWPWLSEAKREQLVLAYKKMKEVTGVEFNP